MKETLIEIFKGTKMLFYIYGILIFIFHCLEMISESENLKIVTIFIDLTMVIAFVLKISINTFKAMFKDQNPKLDEKKFKMRKLD